MSSPSQIVTGAPRGLQLVTSLPKIEITVNSVMDGVPQVTLSVPAKCKVAQLKMLIYDYCNVQPEKQLLLYKDQEIKDDDSPIASYGIIANCKLTMNVKMNTGTRRSTSYVPDLMFVIPESLPRGNVTRCRTVIKGMTTLKGRTKKGSKGEKNNDHKWTPEKQMEHELTRNRMKTLLRKRKKESTAPGATPKDDGSVLHSPLQTPPAHDNDMELATALSLRKGSPIVMTSEKSSDAERAVTEKDLKVFFEPPETMRQLMAKRNDMFTPPSTPEELQKLIEEKAELDKQRCRLCHKHLPLTERTMKCVCERVFCKDHRVPEYHFCIIDYKHTGREKISKENPKISSGGARKAKV